MSVSLLDSVSDHLLTKYLTVLPTDSIVEAARKMSVKNCTEAVVVGDGAPMGIITERDVLYKVVATGSDPSLTKVRAVMSFPIHCIDENAGVGEALLKMKDMRMRRLGVTRKGKFIGLVTYKSILSKDDNRDPNI